MVDRSIIVADASSLNRLQAGVRQEFYEDGVPAGKPVRRYLDLVPFLGGHGHRVVVPEMVAMETAGVLDGAPNISDLFSDSWRNREPADAKQPVKQFLERTKAGKLAGAEIRRSDPASDHGRYLNSLREIAADPVLSRKRKCDLLALAQRHDQKDFGERACLDAIGEMLDRPGGAGGPLFFLSDDKAALKECRERFGERVGRLNAKGFLGGFTRTGLFERLGIRPGLLNAMSGDLLSQDGIPTHGLASSGGPLIDNGRAPDEGNDHGFERQMEALAAEMGPRAADAKSGGAAAVEATSRVDHFRQKWGWNGHLRADGKEENAPKAISPANPDTTHEKSNHKEETLMERKSATMATDGSPYEAYKESFGFRVYDHRHERKMTPEALAAEVSNVMQRDSVVAKAQVIEWEQALAVPDRDQYKALEKLLIDENPAIRPEDKAEARETFALAYQRSAEVIQHQSYEPESLKRRFAFGTLLREHHDQLSGVSLEGLAGKVNERLKIEITEHERRSLTEEPRAFIGAIEAGVVRPSRGLAVALVAALDKARELPEGEKQRLYDAYEAGGGAARVDRSQSADSPRKPRKPSDAEGDRITPEVARTHAELIELFRDDGGKADVTAISAYLRKDLGMSHGAASVVYPLMDESNTSLHRLKKVLSDTAKDALGAFLAEQGKSHEEVAAFEEKFDELRRAVGHRPRQRTAGSLGVT